MKKTTKVLRSGAEIGLTELPLSGMRVFVERPAFDATPDISVPVTLHARTGSPDSEAVVPVMQDMTSF